MHESCMVSLDRESLDRELAQPQKSDSSSTIKPKKKKESSGIDIESTRLASTPTSSSYRLEEESDLSETLELSINNSEALTTHMMPHTN